MGFYSHLIQMVKATRHIKSYPTLPPLFLPQHTAPDGFSPGGADRLDDSSGALVQVGSSVSRGAPALLGLVWELPESRVLLDLALAFPFELLLTRSQGS